MISPSVTVRLFKQLSAPRPAATAREPQEPLTERESEVAALVARGESHAGIARELSIAPGTVKAHVAAAQRKLGVRNRVGVAAWAWERGLVR